MKKQRFSLALLAAAGTLLVAATAASAATGSISGTVTDAVTHAPIQEVPVCAYDTSGMQKECALTGPNGEYVLLELEAGDYKVEFEGEFIFGSNAPYITQWFSGQPSFETATLVHVEEGQVTPGINAALQGPGQISGTVIDAGNGAPINGIEVCVSSTAAEFQFFFSCTMTNAAGQYLTEGLQSGSYKVEFASPLKYNETLEKLELEGPNYVTQYYTGQARPETAAPVTVANGVITSGVNAAMQAGATITGTVTDAVTNAGLQGVNVCAWGATNFECARTDTAGNYSIVTLPAGSYKVEFAPERLFSKALLKENRPAWQRGEFPLVDYAVQYWNDKASFEAAEAVNAIAAQTTSGINAKLVKEVQPPPPLVLTPKPAPGVGIVGPKAKVKGGKALLHVKCKGAGACKGKIKLSARVVQVTRGKGNKARRHPHSAVIGQGSFSIPAGHAKLVPVKLNGAGKLLVSQAGGKGLKAKVSGQGVNPRSVTLKGQTRHKAKKQSHKTKQQHKG